MNTATAEVMPVTDTAVVEYTQTAAGLAKLREQLEGHTFDCTTTAGDKEARQSRMALVRLRVDLEERRKEIKAPVLARGKLIDDEAKRITGEILKLEMPIDDAIRAQERKREEARAEAERKEAERVKANDERLGRIATMPATMFEATPEEIHAAIESLDAHPETMDFDEDYHERAEAARDATIKALQRMHATAVERIAEAERLTVERAELEAQRLQAEQERAAADAAAESERKRLADLEAAEREERRRAEEEASAARQAELDRIAAEQAEQQRALDEQAEQQRQAQAAAEEAERKRVAEAERIERERREREEEERREAEAASLAKAETLAIERATLHKAAAEAVDLLVELGQEQNLTTRKLAAALEREIQA